jgi:hypothetical protein
MDKRFEKLPVEMREAIQGLKALHATPDAMAIQVILGVANLAATKIYNVDSRKYGIRPINEYFICMAPTGAMKTTNYRELLVGVNNYIEYKDDELKTETTRYALDKKVFNKAEAAYLKAMETDPTTAVMPKPIRPVETAKYVISKATVNGIIDQLKSQSFVGLFSSEGGEFFSSHAFQGGKDISKAIEISATLTSIWDGHDIEKVTGMERTYLKNRRANMLMLLQAETIQKLLNTPIFSEQGFIHRMLITQCDSYEKPDWEFTNEAKLAEAQARSLIDQFNVKIGRMMHTPLILRPGKHFELDLRTMKQSNQAWVTLGNWQNSNKNRATGDLHNYAGFAERLHEHALRIAATIAAFEGLDEINEHTALCAIDIMEYYIEQRRNLEVGVSDSDPDRSTGSSKLLDWMLERAWSGTRRELLQNGPSWYRKLNVRQRDLILEDLLVDEHIGIVEMVSASKKIIEKLVLILGSSVANCSNFSGQV